MAEDSNPMLPHTGAAGVPVPDAVSQHSAMALTAVVLSVFAFVLPLGIAALVLGHVAMRRIDASCGRLNGKATARAALVISYVQMALAAAALSIAWRTIRGVVQDYRNDALVQSALREQDARRTLDISSARQEELKAESITVQLAAIQDRNQREVGGYLCDINQLIALGPEGATPAEIRAFVDRVRQSPYAYELSDCANTDGLGNAAHYVLTAAPRLPRMPENSALYCADQTGIVRQVRQGISLDCLDHGLTVR